MFGLSVDAQNTLSRSHSMDVRVIVTSPSFGSREVPISGGSVTVDATSQVRRTAQIDVDPALWPRSPFDLLTPFGSYCTIERGIVIPTTGVTEWVPLGLFVLDESKRSRPHTGDAAVSVSLTDRSSRVAEDEFDAPAQTVRGATVVAEITRLVRATLGSDLPVIDLTGSTQVAPVTEIQAQRWSDGVEKLANSIGAEAFFDVYGQLVIRPQPTLVGASPAWYAHTGDGGNVLSTAESLSRENVYNRVIATGQRADGSAGFIGIATNSDQSTPTWYGGPFGKKPRRYSSPLLASNAQCVTAAQALLARATGVGFHVDFEMIVNPALDAGDVIQLSDSELGETLHIIDRLTIPLTAEGSMSIVTRSNSLPDES